MTIEQALKIIEKWANCEGAPRPPMQNCLCKSCRTYGTPGWKAKPDPGEKVERPRLKR